jgi:hypothetical protein
MRYNGIQAVSKGFQVPDRQCMRKKPAEYSAAKGISSGGKYE